MALVNWHCQLTWYVAASAAAAAATASAPPLLPGVKVVASLQAQPRTMHMTIQLQHQAQTQQLLSALI
jgi:hypothetical protein